MWWNYLKVWFCDDSFQSMFTNRPKTAGKTVANGEKNRSMTFSTFSNVNWLRISSADYIFTKHSITIVFVWFLYNCNSIICICIWLFPAFLNVNWRLSCANYSQNIQEHQVYCLSLGVLQAINLVSAQPRTTAHHNCICMIIVIVFNFSQSS